MGKASRWLRNLLIGKKEEREKKIEGSSFASDQAIVATPPILLPETPRRWSFRRSTAQRLSRYHSTSHRSNRSLDSITQITHPGSIHDEDISVCAFPMKYKHCPVEDAAATKIQAFFRSYLARKALSALRGLVKLQALVKGHMVRKQTTATLRSMHALMTIQVRARLHRIQMAEEKQPSTQSTSEMLDVHVDQIKAFEKHPQIQRTENDGLSTCYSRSVSKAEHVHHQLHMCPSPSASNQSPVNSTKRNYMANTESSKAKVRSQSEPKQRPTEAKNNQKSRRTASIEGMSVGQKIRIQRSCSNAQKNQYPWLFKLYRSTKSAKDDDMTNNPITCRSLIAYEVKRS